MPADFPARSFWAVFGYDQKTRTFIDNGTKGRLCLVKTWSTRFIARLSCVDADHVAPGIIVVICGLRS